MAVHPVVDVAADVRAAAARQQVKHVDIAAALGMSKVSISRRMRGEVEFTIPELVTIADFIGVPLADLLPSPTFQEKAS